MEEILERVAEAVAECCCPSTYTSGMTLPGRYLEHPPQYFPASPEYPLPKELATGYEPVYTTLPELPKEPLPAPRGN